MKFVQGGGGRRPPTDWAITKRRHIDDLNKSDQYKRAVLGGPETKGRLNEVQRLARWRRLARRCGRRPGSGGAADRAAAGRLPGAAASAAAVDQATGGPAAGGQAMAAERRQPHRMKKSALSMGRCHMTNPLYVITQTWLTVAVVGLSSLDSENKQRRFLNDQCAMYTLED